MHISAIISEYNPFHNGHLYHINETRKLGATHVVCVMSGNFVQRGSCAILEKQARTEMALRGGADLVLELPCIWSMSTAEKFAFAGVYIINSLGCIDSISFGSEIGNIDELENVCDAINSEQIRSALHFYLNSGLNFAQSRQKAVEEVFGNDVASLLGSPNNILGIEYLKALRCLKSKVVPITVKRQGCGHDDELIIGNFASASKIRDLIFSSPDNIDGMIPTHTANIIKKELALGRAPATVDYLERAILSKLRIMSRDELSALPDVSEGLENRIYNAIRNTTSINDLYSEVKTKRYSLARIRRIILCAFLGINKTISNLPISYVRVLGLNDRGKEILKKAKSTSSIPIVTKVSDIQRLNDSAKQIFNTECRATDLYQLCLPKPGSCGLEMTRKLVKIH